MIIDYDGESYGNEIRRKPGRPRILGGAPPEQSLKSYAPSATLNSTVLQLRGIVRTDLEENFLHQQHHHHQQTKNVGKQRGGAQGSNNWQSSSSSSLMARRSGSSKNSGGIEDLMPSIPNTCIVCTADIYRNSVLFHCECMATLCQACALNQIAAQPNTYFKGE
jgi:hypothetical protein